MLGTTEGPCPSKTLETFIPMRDGTLGCKPQEDYGEPMSQYYNSVPTKNYYVLQCSTPVLLCTTKYYSSPTPVLLQCYSVLQSTTWVALHTTLY